MQLLSVIPITNAPLPETLSYLSKKGCSAGDVIEISVANRTLLGVVSEIKGLHEAKHVIKHAKYEIKTLDSTITHTKLTSEQVYNLEWIAERYLVPRHHVLDTLTPKSVVQNMDQKPLFCKRLVMCPTWRQAEFVGAHEYPAATILHSQLTDKQQNKILTMTSPETIITTPAFAWWLAKNTEKIIIHEQRNEHYYRHRRPFFDLGMAIEELARAYKIKIETPTTPGNHTCPVVYDILNTDIKYGYTVVMRPQILRYIQKLLQQNKRVLVLSPRKGLASGVRCLDCGRLAIDEDSGQRYRVAIDKDGVYHYESARKRGDARHTCQFCNGTRLSMFGFGSDAFQKVLEKNFPNEPLHIIDQTTGKRALDRAKKESKGLVVATTPALWHLEPGTYTTILLGLEYLLGIPFYNQLYKTIRLIQLSMSRSQELYIPVYEEKSRLIQQLQDGEYQSLLSEDTALREQFSYPPFGHILVAEAIVNTAAELQISTKLQQSLPKDQTHIESYPHGPSSKRLRVLVTAPKSTGLEKAVVVIQRYAPNATMMIDPRTA